jgi:magnesium chelatase subunit D
MSSSDDAAKAAQAADTDASATLPESGSRTSDNTEPLSGASRPVLRGAPAEGLGAQEMAAQPADAYPEDHATPRREAAPLRLPWRRPYGRPTDRGLIIGTTQAGDLDDIAWVSTLFEAAKYQTIRRRNRSDQRAGLLVSASDLRRYRRAPEADYLLALVLDHTCREGWDWTAVLAPHLQRAYRDRASLCVVELGAADAVSPLRAERALLRSMLEPRAAMALERDPGSASPLAHGIELARVGLRHAMQHGRAAVTAARLVVITDALGNVPLSASLHNDLTTRVSAEGVADAMTAARALGELDHVETYVAFPPHAPYPDLVAGLALAFGPKCLIVDSRTGR